MSNLKQILSDTSKQIYGLMEVHPRVRQIHEDAITSIFIKNILKADDCKVEAFNLGVKESKTGLDLELWIGEEDKGYYRLCIQAKSFGNNTSINDSYKINQNQCALLLDRSHNCDYKGFPFYFFYQYLPGTDISSSFPGLQNANEETSITFTSALSIREFLPNEIGEKPILVRFKEVYKENSNNIYDSYLSSMFNGDNKKVGLPIESLAFLRPAVVEDLRPFLHPQKLILGYYYFYYYFKSGGLNKLKLHKINRDAIYLDLNKRIELGLRPKNAIIIEYPKK